MKTILVLTNFTETATNAAEYAFRLATHVNADVLLFNTYDIPLAIGADGDISHPLNTPEYLKAESTVKLEAMVAHLESLKEKFAPHYPRISYASESGSDPNLFEKLEKENEVSMIIIGEKSPRNFFDRVLITNPSTSLIENAKYPVLLLGCTTRFKPFKDVTFACGTLDYLHLKAIDFVTDMIGVFDAELDVVHISDCKDPEKTKTEGIDYIQSATAFKTFINYPNLAWHKLKGYDIASILEKFSGFINADMTCIIHQRHPFYDSVFHDIISKSMMSNHKKPILIFPPTFGIHNEQPACSAKETSGNSF